MMSTNIVCIVPSAFAEKIINLRASYGISSTPRQNDTTILKDRPHFSVIPSFFVVDRNEFIKRLDAFVFDRFDVSIVSVEIFKTRFGNTVVGVIEQSSNLKHLQAEIDTTLITSIQSKHPELEGENYVHHVTFGYSVESSQLKKFQDSVKRILPMKFIVDKLEALETVDEITDERKRILTIESKK